jgi:uncharacterized protein
LFLNHKKELTVSVIFESIGLGLLLIFMAIGFIGAFIPLLPGALLVWLSVLVYTVITKFTVIEPGLFITITLIALIAGTANIWLAMLGAKAGGAAPRSLAYGLGGSILGFFVFNLLGAVLGYAAGILASEYLAHRQWRLALRAGLAGVAGWGISSLVEAGGALAIIIIFVWKAIYQV